MVIYYSALCRIVPRVRRRIQSNETPHQCKVTISEQMRAWQQEASRTHDAECTAQFMRPFTTSARSSLPTRNTDFHAQTYFIDSSTTTNTTTTSRTPTALCIMERKRRTLQFFGLRFKTAVREGCSVFNSRSVNTQGRSECVSRSG